jgi:hypothetical protein
MKTPVAPITPAVMSANDAAIYVGASRAQFYKLWSGVLVKPLDVGSRGCVFRRRDLDAALDSLAAKQLVTPPPPRNAGATLAARRAAKQRR